MASLGRVSTSLLRFSLPSSINRNINTTMCALGIKSRWAAPFRRALYNRQKKMVKKGLTVPDKRSTYIEWNYETELYAFGKRLGEEFDEGALREALTDASYIQQELQRQHDLGVASPALAMPSNQDLTASGTSLITQYCRRYLRAALPLFPEEGISGITEYLSSEEVLAEVGAGIGLRDLILCEEHPPAPATMARVLQAVVGALGASSGVPCVESFIRDFLLTHLVGKDLNTFWKIEAPLEVLGDILGRSGQGEPEPRLIFQTGRNTIQAAYHVGVYADKVFLGAGFGETVSEAVNQAAQDALRRLFHTTDAAPPLPFGPQAEKLAIRDDRNLSIHDWSAEKAGNIVTC